MGQNVQGSFEEVFKAYEKRIYYHIRRLNIYDPHQEFYQEGLYAMWKAVQTYQPEKSRFSTHLHHTIYNGLVDLMRTKVRQQRYDIIFCKEGTQKQKSGNRYRNVDMPMHDDPAATLHESELWENIASTMTPNQWKWVKYHIFIGMSNREIAEQEHVSVEAVKSWAKKAKKKLRKEWVREELLK